MEEENLVTTEQFQDWFGSDHCERWQDLTDLLLEIANGKYTAEQFKKDVQEWWEATVEEAAQKLTEVTEVE